MARVRRYIHIGYPKSASTSVQHTLLGNHPELYHLGNGYQGKNNVYIDDAVTKFAEVDVRYKREFSYKKDEAIAAFEPHFKAAEEDDKFKAVGLSSEFFCFNLSNEVDVVTKAKRLHEVFGDNTCIIIVIREQLKLLTSLYTEMVKGGYPGTFKRFLEYTYLFQDRSWCFEFCFDLMFETYANLFGSENICMVPLELLKASETEFTSKVCQAIGVSTANVKMKQLNQQVDLVFYELMRRFNEKCPHEFGSAFYEPFAVMRMNTYFHHDLGVAVPHENLLADFLRMPLAKGAAALSKRGYSHVPKLDLTIPKGLGDRLTKIYAASNAALAKKTGLDLAKYGYVL